MMSTSDKTASYDGIASFYEKWSSGDPAYFPSKNFYLKILSKYRGKFLELGIGTGRIALELLRRKEVEIVGIDSSEAMLHLCQSRARKLYEDGCLKGTLHLQRENMLSMRYENEFDIVYLPFRTIGHILDDRDVLRLFVLVYEALKKDGCFLVDHYMFQKEWALAHNKVRIPMYQDDETLIEDYYCYDFSGKKMHCRIYVNNKVQEQFDYRWFEAEELDDIAQNAGFRLIEKYGDYDGSVWTPNSDEQILVLQK